MALNLQLDELINGMLPFVQHCHKEGDFAPHAGSMDQEGEIAGIAFVSEEETDMSVEEGLPLLESRLREAAEAEKIVASAIFFHGATMSEPLRPAETEAEACSLVVLAEHVAGDSIALVIPYHSTENGIDYEKGTMFPKPAVVFAGIQSKGKSRWRFWRKE